MLGPSESVGALAHAFSPLDKKLKIYLKQPRSEPLNFPVLATEPRAANIAGNEPASGNARMALDVQKTAERILLAQYAPAGVIVDDALNIVYVRGDTGPYLQITPGEPTYSLLKMAREGLVVSLRTAILKARQKKAAVKQQAHVKHSGQYRDVNLRVVPINAATLHLLVLFEEVTPPAASGPAPSGENAAKPQKAAGKAKTNGARREITRLTQELASTREYLQSIIEEQEASTEELKSANEEAQASNEELETAKEELQSANEELNTLNDELKTRNLALTEVNTDLTNVLTSINVPMVMVGRDLKIRRFTQAMEPMLNLIDSDVGRPIADLKPNIDVPDLLDLLRGAVNGSISGREIRGPNGRWWSLQALPYNTADNKMDGALLVLLDIDAVKHGRDFAEAIVETVQQPLVVMTEDLKVQSANQAFYETFRVSKEETENRLIYELGNCQWNIPKLRKALEELLLEKTQLRKFEVEHKFENVGLKTVVLNTREIQQPVPYGKTILLAIEDITERKRAEDQIRRTNEDLKHFAYAASHDLQEPLRIVTICTQMLSRKYKGKLDKEADQHIAYAGQGAERMESLLKGMREYWQASERGEEHHAAIDCNDILKKTLLNLQATITENGAAVTYDFLPTIPAEEVMLVQLFQNLIGNAIKYRSERPPHVHISAEKNDKEEWVFSIEDNGIGIDPQYAEKISECLTV